MYDLSTDIGEKNDLSKKDTTSLNLLNAKLKDWESNMMPPLWKEEKEWMDVTYHIHQRLMQNKKALYIRPKSYNE